MKTILTIKQQHEFLNKHNELRVIKHKWSCRGNGYSRILDNYDAKLGSATGGGYDRYGAALADAMNTILHNEITKLAKRLCKGKNKRRQTCKEFYGLFYNDEEGFMYLDGACGSNCMKRILNKVGFDLDFISEVSNQYSGMDFYTLSPISKHTRKYL